VSGGRFRFPGLCCSRSQDEAVRRSVTRLPSSRGISHEVRQAAERCLPSQPPHVGFAAAPRRRAFPSSTRLPVRPFPASFESGSFSRALRPLQSFFARPPCRALSGRRLLPGFLPSSRHRRWRPRTAEHSRSASFRPRAFAAPRRFAPPPVPRACFIPLPRPGFSVQGFAPAPQPRRLIAGRGLRAVVTPALTGCPAATLAPLGFEALIRVAIRIAGSGVGLARDRSPLRFRSPPSGSGEPAAAPASRCLRS